MSDKKISADIRKFIDAFQPEKFKILSGGLEVRGVNDVVLNIARANQVIEKHHLRLKIHHNAEMRVYGAFEINDSSPP